MRMSSLALGALVAWLAVGLAGCGPPATGGAVTDPSGTVKRWRAASDGDDPKAAYALLSPALQKKITYPEFERRWKENQKERARQSSALAAGEGDDSTAQAEVVLGDGKKTVLVRESKFWRFESPLITSTRASTPNDALKLFATALDDRNFYAAMKLLTSTRKEGINGFLDQFVTGLRGQIGKEITITGDNAVIEWKEGSRTFRVRLKKEDGEWRIDDIDF
jgi:hypothetical protein